MILGHFSVLKGVASDHILIPRAQLEVVLFLMSNEKTYFSEYKSKISPLNYLLSFEDIAENVKLIVILIFHFLFI